MCAATDVPRLDETKMGKPPLRENPTPSHKIAGSRVPRRSARSRISNFAVVSRPVLRQSSLMTPEDIQAILDANFAPWVKALNIETLDVSADHCLFRMPLTEDLARAGGIVSGQALAALADTTMVLAAIAHAGKLTLFATTNLDTQFLRPGVGKAIICKASVVRSGKALVFTRAEMTEETSGKLVATSAATLYAP